MPTVCAPRLEVFAVPGLPVLRAGDDLSNVVLAALRAAEIELRDGDVLVVASKAVSRCEGRFVNLTTVEPSGRALDLSRVTTLDARFVELVVRESVAVSRTAREALIVRDRHGFVHANAGIDLSNAKPTDAPAASGPWALLLPVDPDASAESIRSVLSAATKAAIGVIVSDSFGRPFRLGTVGTAIGVAGVPALWNKRGEVNLFDRTLEHTETALADRIAATADLVAGQGGEGRAAVVVRGVSFDVGEHGVHELLRPPNKDLLRMTSSSVVALSGGVGGARLLRGLARALPAGALTAIVNTGDDFEHWGLHVSPDVDTVMYTLAGLSHEERGWGLAEESFFALERLRAYGEDGWFMIGDRNLATHLARTRGFARGETLTQVTSRLCRALGVTTPVLPMSDGRRRTMIDTKDHGPLPFQTWFVTHRAEPPAERVWFDGDAPATPEVLAAIDRAELVVIGPSNPYVSIDPIFALPGVRDALFAKPVVAVSPIVGGQAVKGPLAVMIPKLTGAPASAAAVAAHYPKLRGIVVENGDDVPGVRSLATATVMKSADDSERLARAVLEFARTLS